MVYMILSWRDALEQMLEQEEELGGLCCPLCMKQHDMYQYTQAIRHLKACYTARRLKSALFNNQHMSRDDRIHGVQQTALEVEQEINRYLNGLTGVSHLF